MPLESAYPDRFPLPPCAPPAESRSGAIPPQDKEGLDVGRIVRVHCGLLQGVQGVVLEILAGNRLLIAIGEPRGGVALEIERAVVQAVG